jgi:hypothetical protein
MNKRLTIVSRPFAAVALCVSALSIVAAASCSFSMLARCADEDSESTVDVTGTFRYAGDVPGPLTGTVVLEQEGDTVRVLDSTSDFSPNRALEGEGTLAGNRLDIRLVPRNGDTDYIADVTFVFSDGGREFCVSFSDTNDDAGVLGSFIGTRVSRSTAVQDVVNTQSETVVESTDTAGEVADDGAGAITDDAGANQSDG